MVLLGCRCPIIFHTFCKGALRGSVGRGVRGGRQGEGDSLSARCPSAPAGNERNGRKVRTVWECVRNLSHLHLNKSVDALLNSIRFRFLAASSCTSAEGSQSVVRTQPLWCRAASFHLPPRLQLQIKKGQRQWAGRRGEGFFPGL